MTCRVVPMPKIQLFYIFLTSMLTSLVLIPPISKLAVSIGVFDDNDERKVHTGAIPRLGGIAIFFAVLLSVILFSEMNIQVRGFLAGAIVIFLTGLTDDLAKMPPTKKLLGELMAAWVATVVGELHLTSLGNLFGEGAINLHQLSVPFTVFAIVGVINAVNLLDGLDGLAGGVTAISTCAIGLLAYLAGDNNLAVVCVALLGGVVGFLKFNSYPARIFMGDGGSLFLGYCLAVISVQLAENARGRNSVLIPLIILAVPVFDTLYVMATRFFTGKALFLPDRNHIHHRFMDLGLGHKSTVILVYGLSYCLAAYSVVFRGLTDQQQLINMVLFLIMFCVLNWTLARLLNRQQNQFLVEDNSVLNCYAFRWMVQYSQYVLVLLKYLALAALALPLLTFAHKPGIETATVAWLLTILTVLLYLQTADWTNHFLQIVICINGSFLIFVVENCENYMLFAGVPLKLVSALLFTGLFLCFGTLLFLRKKSKLLIKSPLEYFGLFIVISIPLLPSTFTHSTHLLTVAGKSLVLFFSYKMVMLLNVRRNRKIIVATMVSLLFIAVRGFL
jgi:UDP-GlcNAc:undecaprenyl-phosphate/decaprenyl-phosphate GlcNAc-1-phosphate transferase